MICVHYYYVLKNPLFCLKFLSVPSLIVAFWVSSAESTAENLANSLEFVCLLQSPKRPRSDHRHVYIPAFVSRILERLKR